MQPNASLPIGRLLIDKGLISDDQLRIAMQEQARQPMPLGGLLVRLGFLSDAALRDTLSEKLGHESISLLDFAIDPAALALIPKELAQRHRLLPLALNETDKLLTIAIADPDDILALDQVQASLHGAYRIIPRLASAAELQRALDRHYGQPVPIASLLHEIQPDERAVRPARLQNDDSSQPLVKLVESLLVEAVREGASDIHFEPESGFLRIRYRIDGVLRQTLSLHRSFWPTMLVRLKVLSGMNIAETRAPQDGHFSRELAGRTIDFRAAAHPTLHGENLVLRILDRQQSIVPLTQIGLDATALATLHEIIAKPEGIVLVTGPTGSGKTTTLYSILSHLNQESVNIMTLEDPVEYPVPLIRQTSVNEAAKLDFANGIRSMMRQDPDIILIGEIRDQPTAEMAFRAAMTGHQVYATLHTNSALGAIPRLLDIGILPDIMAGNISGILAQRLVRVLCPHCKQPDAPDAAERRTLGLPLDAGAVIHRPVGCPRCQHQGYTGRHALMELLRLDDDLDELVAQRGSLRALKRLARTKGFRPLADDGRAQVLNGLTSLTEVARVADLSEGLAP
ncbi:MAG: type II/IV secretion system protein [Nitrosomonadales bacterium]|nr:type II/IV secretion system protein [Nitrosomonadales bacterium]